MVLREAVLGAGNVSRRHLTGIEHDPRSQLVGVCDLDEDAARAAAEPHGATVWTDPADVWEEDLDIVHVCTPVQTHYDLASEALAHDVNVVLQKPTAESSKQIDALAEEEDKSEAIVCPVHNEIFRPAGRKATAIVDGGELGAIEAVSTRFTGLTPPDAEHRGEWVFELPGGEFEEGLPHPLYVTLRVGGYPADEEAIDVQTALNGDYDGRFAYDAAQVQYRSAEGTLCSVQMVANGTDERAQRIHGAEGALFVDFPTDSVHRAADGYGGGPLAKLKRGADQGTSQLAGSLTNIAKGAKSRFADSWAAQVAVNDHFALFDAVRDAVLEGRASPVPLEQARWTLAILETIHGEIGADV